MYRRIELKHRFNPDDFVTEQVFATSKDGTRIPMFIVHKKGIKLDGSNPTLLYGYGGRWQPGVMPVCWGVTCPYISCNICIY